MSSESWVSEYSLGEEIAHAVTHGIGAALSIAGLAVLVAFSALYGNVWHITSSSIYGATLILCYTASTLYHSIPHPRAKRILRQIDHASIFLLIAGTYTPFALVSLRDSWGWWLFGGVWGIALFGMIFELFTEQRYKKASLALYLGMGWLAVATIKPMLDSIGMGGLTLLLIGGLFYSLGVIFYVWDRLSYNHAVWHLFVLAGSAFHFFAILFYVIPDGHWLT
ncbi:hemolysin III [Sedimenticola thiotaurini]|uniref:Hemolysin III n=2 Tax=Sedimenticola thiotaurini TaxID=1543721 RepID=A0A0F7K479_9GAMM|nr:hemolysin III family protein [Sedimenticola thiotaurini]AKH21763.1 hemolysin III [Sedimenticola thiotaurini]